MNNTRPSAYSIWQIVQYGQTTFEAVLAAIRHLGLTGDVCRDGTRRWSQAETDAICDQIGKAEAAVAR